MRGVRSLSSLRAVPTQRGGGRIVLDGASLFESTTMQPTGDSQVDGEVWLMATRDIEDAILEAIDPVHFRRLKEVGVL